MKILFVITKAEIGGAQVFVLNLATELKNHGYEVEVVAGDGKYLENEFNKRTISFHFLNSLKRDYSIINSLYFIFDLWRLLKREKFDLIHLNSSNTLIGSVAAYFIKSRPNIFFTFHGLSFLDKNYKVNYTYKYITRIYFRLLLKFVDNSVFVSNLNHLEAKKYNLIKKGNVIYNGLAEDKLNFLPAYNARKYLSDICKREMDNSFILGSVGRLAYPKNYEFLINNFYKIKERIPNAKLIIIGDGPNITNYKKMILKNGLNDEIILLGELKDAYQYLKAFDVFTLPSIYEGLSISLIEALFAELPILASNVGGNTEVVKNHSSQLYELDNIEDYIKKLEMIIQSKEEIVLHNAALKKEFSLEKMVKSYIDLYESFIVKK